MSPTFKLHSSDTRTPVAYKNSISALSRGRSQAIRRASSSCAEKAFLIVLSIRSDSIRATGLSFTRFSFCRKVQKLFRYRIRPCRVTMLILFRSRSIPKYHLRSIVVMSSMFFRSAFRQLVTSRMYCASVLSWRPDTFLDATNKRIFTVSLSVPVAWSSFFSSTTLTSWKLMYRTFCSLSSCSSSRQLLIAFTTFINNSSII